MKLEEMEKLKHHADDIVEHDSITGQVNGIGDKLKATQAYPKAYGVAVAMAFSDDQAVCEVSSDSDSSKDEGEMAHPEDLWPDAELAPVCSWLGIPHVRLLA